MNRAPYWQGICRALAELNGPIDCADCCATGCEVATGRLDEIEDLSDGLLDCRACDGRGWNPRA